MTLSSCVRLRGLDIVLKATEDQQNLGGGRVRVGCVCLGTNYGDGMKKGWH